MCQHLPKQDVPNGQWQCFGECCDVHVQCYADHACSVGVDWPNALSAQCAICNAQLEYCGGSCMVEEPFSFDPTACVNLCSHPAAFCGMPDACGGVCTDERLCGLLARRVEMLAPLQLLLMP